MPTIKILLIFNDPPYGTERSYNGLRLAKALTGKGMEVTVFLMADAVACTKAGQLTTLMVAYWFFDPRTPAPGHFSAGLHRHRCPLGLVQQRVVSSRP